MLQSETARAFDGLREGAEKQRGRRTAVGQAVGRWQRPEVEDAFEQWLETLLESKRLSDLDERDMRIVELEGDTTITLRNRDTDGFVILDALQLLPSQP